MSGDAGAAREYAEWVRTISPDRFERNVLEVLEPLYRRPDDPDLAAAAAWLFGDPKSPWLPLVGRKGSRSSFHVAQLITSPMVEVPAFRKMLIAALDDRSPIGEAEAGKNGMVSVKLDDGFSMGRGAPQGRSRPPCPGHQSPRPYRRFLRLAALDPRGAPGFNPCWTEPQRDAGLAAIRDFLNRKGPRPGLMKSGP